MIGLMFLGVLIAWSAIALALGIKLPQWLGVKRFRPWASVLLVPMIFFAPVADEIIAYPQMQALCKEVRGFQFAPGMDAQKAYGRTVYYQQPTSRLDIFPSTVSVERMEMRYVDVTTQETVFHAIDYGVTRGWLGVPAGSSGDKMAVLLKGCGADLKTHFAEVKVQLKALNITEIPTP